MFRRRPASAHWGYVKSCRKTGEFAHAIGAILIDPERRNRPRRHRRDRCRADRHHECRGTVRRAHRRRLQGALRRARRRRPAGKGRRLERGPSPYSCQRAEARGPRGGRMSMIATHREPARRAGVGGTAYQSCGFRSRQARSDRYASRLRTRRLRRVHGAARRRAGALVHHLCRCLRRGRSHHDRRPRRRRGDIRTSCGLHPRTCAAMRLLHAGNAGLRARSRAAPAASR